MRFLSVCLFLLSIYSPFLLAQTELMPDMKSPSWVNKRPNSGLKYVGIGMAEKNVGSNYQNEAKKNALFDLTSEIKVDISTNSILHTIQNNSQFNESFNSMIKLSNSDNIEGYTLVDSYENDKQYWMYYELDRQEYENQKARKKQLAISKAVNFINLSFTDEKEGNFTSSLKKRIQAFGILSPYLNEDLKFEAQGNIKTIFDLSNTIQKQIQSISINSTKTNSVLKPYQSNYKPVVYNLNIKGKNQLLDFPFIIKSESDQIRIFENATTNSNGDLEVSVKSIKPINQDVILNFYPDFNKLVESDSTSRTAIIILKQFIETSQLKASVSVKPISIYVSCNEANLSKAIDKKMLEPIVEAKFNTPEVKIIHAPQNADYAIEIDADTKKDVSSDVLKTNYGVQLALLNVNLVLRDMSSGDILYKTEISGIYGYANDLQLAGVNAYYSEKLKIKMSEALFFLKRKMIVY
jgi:hypothetical protein